MRAGLSAGVANVMPAHIRSAVSGESTMSGSSPQANAWCHPDTVAVMRGQPMSVPRITMKIIAPVEETTSQRASTSSVSCRPRVMPNAFASGDGPALACPLSTSTTVPPPPPRPDPSVSVRS